MARSRPESARDPSCVVVYSRVSTSAQAERDLSLPAQEDAAKHFAARRGQKVQRVFREAGASGTDDQRPVFQQMISHVLAPGSKVGAILVYQSSRFMRNVTKARVYKDRLRRAGARVIAVQQETSDDPMGRMIETFFEGIDQYESEINGVRTRAAMRKNAEQGWFNGARAPFGFQVLKRTLPTGVTKGVLAPSPTERATLRIVFDLYVGGLGAKAVARELNRRALRYRGDSLWSKDRVLTVIEEEAAIGTYWWGKRDHRTGQPYPREEWIAIQVEPVIEREVFTMAQQVRAQRDPEKNPGRTGSSPTLLAGLLRCGRCDASYRLETSGKLNAHGEYPYRYYNCRNALRVGAERCSGRRIAVATLDRAVLEHVAEAVFSEERCRTLLRDLLEHSGALRRQAQERREQLSTELDGVEKALTRWYAAFEAGADMAALGAERLKELQSRRDTLRTALEAAQVPATPPAYLHTTATIRAFQTRLRTRLLAGDVLARNYLRFLVDRVVVRHDRAELRIRGEAAAHLIAEGDNEKAPPVNPGGAVHTSVCGWLPKGAGSMNFETAFPLRSGREHGADGVKEPGASRLAKALARAEEGARLLASGEVARRSELARRWGVTRARVTQVLGLLGLHPRLRAFLIGTNAPLSERRLREVVRAPAEAQVAWAQARVPGFADASVAAAAAKRHPAATAGGGRPTAAGPRRVSETKLERSPLR